MMTGLPERVRFVHTGSNVDYRDPVRWEALFDDLEAQFAAAAAGERAASVGELTRAERATVRLDGRLEAALGARVVIRVRGGAQLSGELLDVAREWLLVGEGMRRHLVPAHALAAVGGLGHAVAPESRSVLRSLGLGHALRALSRDRVAVQLSAVGVEISGRIDAVGADHVNVTALGDDRRAIGGGWVVPLGAIDVVSSA